MTEMTLQERREKWEREHGFSRTESLIMRRMSNKAIAAARKRREEMEKRAARHAERVDRVRRIIAMKREGASLLHIAKAEHRSKQAISAFIQRYGTNEEKALFDRRLADYVDRPCAKCGTNMHVREKDRRQHCSQACAVAARRKYPDRKAREDAYNERRKAQWRTDSKFRARHMALSMKRYHRVKDTPEYQAKQKLYTLRYRQRKNGQPETPLS